MFDVVGLILCSDLLQGVLAGARRHLFGLLQRCLPLDIGVGILEVVVVAVPAGLLKVLAQLTVGQGCAFRQASAQALIQRHGSKEANMPISGRMGHRSRRGSHSWG